MICNKCIHSTLQYQSQNFTKCVKLYGSSELSKLCENPLYRQNLFIVYQGSGEKIREKPRACEL